ncbi:MAG: hypothetical protein OXI81_08370 [Paracoccaceae bacterium]|nr:hypothetical protein [Paracoccaceae bacterium]
MAIQTLDIAQPFFSLRFVENETSYTVEGKVIVLNLAETPVRIREQSLRALQSVVLNETRMHDIGRAVVVERFADYPDEEALMARVRDTWPTAFEVRGEERLRGVGHYMSPKVWVGPYGFTLYHSATVPLNVGLHRDHAFCPVPGFREVHTQIMGVGKMQQCRENDIATLYLEEPMAPGQTHRPMYDSEGNYPWHQFETITPGIFMAVEMLPDGAMPPQLERSR